MLTDRSRAQARKSIVIARSIKQRLLDLEFSPTITCSIGIAPTNSSRDASDMDSRTASP
jgi:hypothetical protein